MGDAAILLAAGKGRRMQGATSDKILTPLRGKPVFAYSVEAFGRARVVERMVVVYRDREQRLGLARALEYVAEDAHLESVAFDWVQGGAERQDSVFNGLSHLPLSTAYSYIHDCARPLVEPGLLLELRELTHSDGAAVLAHRVTDTIKRVRSVRKSLRRHRLLDVRRAGLWAMETPQGFAHEQILEAYRRLRSADARVTDDVGALEQLRLRVSLLENPRPNPKITTPADLDWAEFLLARRECGTAPLDLRGD